MKPIVSQKSAKAISVGIFLISLALLTYFDFWWPGIMLAVGLPLALRHYLLGRKLDMWVTLFVFLGVFVTVEFRITWEYLLPALFALGGIYILVREYLECKQRPTGKDDEES